LLDLVGMSAEEFLNFIDGEFVPAQNKDTFTKTNPFNGEILGIVAASDAMDVIYAIQAAKKAQAEYEKWSLHQRADLLSDISDQLEEKIEAISFLEALHQGLPQRFVKQKSLLPAIAQFREASDACEFLAAKKDPELILQPSGVVSIIVSWNLSLRLLAERLAPALAAGNVCLVKVSEQSPITAKILGDILLALKAPKGLVQFIHGRGPEVGAVLAAHPSVRAVNFVGKLSNAENVVKGALPQFKKVQIQTGAKNSCLILADADFKKLLPKIMESFLIGQGQMCWNTTRLFVLETVQKEVAEAMKTYFATLKPATSPKDASAWWPVISPEVLACAETKSQQIKLEEGKLLTGGQRHGGPGFFFQPTVSLDLPNCSELQQEELRAPILILTAVKYPHEMVKWVNTGYYAHSAVVWGSETKALAIAEKIDVGTVSLNSWLPEEVQAGHRQSSFGNMQIGPWGRFYSDVKVLTRPQT
jgi:aminomuconate-semialdehyde/2-hydroxymuconate-6-semialdehyde dehydrogenase